jgi:hypothetical protein
MSTDIPLPPLDPAIVRAYAASFVALHAGQALLAQGFSESSALELAAKVRAGLAERQAAGTFEPVAQLARLQTSARMASRLEAHAAGVQAWRERAMAMKESEHA